MWLIMDTIAINGNDTYLAIIGDLRGSRELAQRGAVQNRLEDGLAHVNERAGARLASRFVLTIGDEFQGLVAEPGEAMAILAEVESALFDLGVRYGLGIGPLSTALRPDALRMDGPCFHAAREALELAKRRDRWAVLRGAGERQDPIANGILTLMDAIRGGWTPRQKEAVATRRRHALMKDAARAMGIRGPTLSKSLKAAHYAAWREGEEAMALLLRTSPGAGRPAPGHEGGP
jgi:hypothetical protein